MTTQQPGREAAPGELADAFDNLELAGSSVWFVQSDEVPAGDVGGLGEAEAAASLLQYLDAHPAEKAALGAYLAAIPASDNEGLHEHDIDVNPEDPQYGHCRTCDWLGNLAELAQAVPADNEHPEDTCQRCGRPNPVWSAPNHLWNEVMGGPNGIVCPSCFAAAAPDRIWRFIPASDNEGLADAIRRVEGLTIQFVDEAGRPYEPADQRDDEDWADHLARRIGVATPEPPREREGLRGRIRERLKELARDEELRRTAPSDGAEAFTEAIRFARAEVDAILAAARSVTPLEGVDNPGPVPPKPREGWLYALVRPHEHEHPCDSPGSTHYHGHSHTHPVEHMHEHEHPTDEMVARRLASTPASPETSREEERNG